MKKSVGIVSCIICLLLLMAQTVCMATTYYVSTSGNDDNDGKSVATAWKTIDNGDYLGAEGGVVAGDTVIVLAGTYDVSPNNPLYSDSAGLWLQNQSGTAGSPITYTTSGGDVIIDAGGSSAIQAMKVSWLNYLVFDGFTFNNATSLVYMNACQNIEIRNCHFTNWGTSGGYQDALFLNGCSNCLIHNNLVTPQTGNNDEGFQDQPYTVGGNEFYNNTFVGVWCRTFMNNSGGSTPAQFINNIVTNGMSAMFGTDPNLIHSNNMFYNMSYGAFWPYGSDVLTLGANETTTVDPELLSDYHLTPGSPAIGAGINVSLPYPGSEPDLGAFQTPAVPAGSATITGVVTNAGAGAPISGALVTYSVGGYSEEIFTGADGSYSVPAPVGSQTVTASAIGYKNNSATVTVPATGSVTANIVLTQSTAIVGVITDAKNGSPISGATVTVGGNSTTTAADGSYTLLASAGSQTVTASSALYVTNSATVTVPASGNGTANIVLTRQSAVMGVVTAAATGLPVSGATVSVGGNSTTTATDGSYSLLAPSGSQTVTASATDYTNNSVSVTVPTNDWVTANIALTCTIANTTYYVDGTNGSDSNNGKSWSAAWKSIDNGDRNSILNPGDTVIVKAGTYDVSSSNPVYSDGNGLTLKVQSGISGTPITYTTSGGTVIIDAGSETATQSLNMHWVNYIVLNGFQFQDAAFLVQMYSCQGIEIKNCLFTNWGGTAAYSDALNLYGCSYCFVHNNVIAAQTGNHNEGIQDEPGGVGGDRFYNNTITGVWMRAFMNNSGGSTPAQFINNIITNVGNGLFGTDPNLIHSNNMMYDMWYVPSGYWTNGILTAGPNETITVDPNLLPDYHLTPGSPAIDAGINVGLPYAGSAPDLGAFETPVIPAGSGTITGYVTNVANGMPIPGALVSVTIGGLADEAFTGADGSYSLPAPSGSQTVTASATDYVTNSVAATVPANGSVSENIPLTCTITSNATYYVDPTNGNDSNSGLSTSAAWKSINNGDVKGILLPGDTVNVLAGTYSVSSAITIGNNSGVGGRPIIYQTSGGSVTLNGPQATFGSVFSITANYIAINGFNLTGAGSPIQATGVAGVDIENCQFSQCGTSVGRNGLADTNAWYPVINLVSCSYCLVHHNLMYNLLQGYTEGIWDVPSNGGSAFYNNTIVGNNTWYISVNQPMRAFTSENGVQLPLTQFKNNIVDNFGSGLCTDAWYNHIANAYNNYFNCAIPYGAYSEASAAGPHETTTVDPLLSSTYYLLPGSPCIAAGVNVGLPFTGSAPNIGDFGPVSALVSSTIAGLIGQTDGTVVELSTSVVTVPTGVLANNVIYVEQANRVAGIRVVVPSGTTLTAGQVIQVNGQMATTTDAERYIQSSSVTVLSSGSPVPALGMTGKAVVALAAKQSDGLLVKTWGKVSYSSSGYFTIDDGSGCTDGAGHTGVPVLLSAMVSPPTAPSTPTYVSVTGVVSWGTVGTVAVPVILPQSNSAFPVM